MRLLYSQKQHSYLSFKLILFSHANPEVPAKQGFISAFPFSSPFFLCMTSKIISFFFLVDFFSVLAYNEHS